MMGCTRGFYSLAARKVGPKPDVYQEISPKTQHGDQLRSARLLLSALWLAYFYGANLVEVPWFGVLSFDSSELPIITVYAMYVPMFIAFMVKQKDLGTVKRFVMPTLGVLGCLFMVYAAIVSHGMKVACISSCLLPSWQSAFSLRKKRNWICKSITFNPKPTNRRSFRRFVFV
jgi:APA family basic amino acid/polyamine antiporter